VRDWARRRWRTGPGKGGPGAGAVWAGGARQIWSAAAGRRRAGGGVLGWARVCVMVGRGFGPGGDKEIFFLKKILC